MSEYKVLDKGFVRLDGYMADDSSVINSARVSFNQQAASSDELNDKDRGLINFLMKNRHGTPFEHNAMRFHVKAPIFVAREWFRHRIGSFNEWSGRYSRLEPDFYIPDHVRSQVGKPGAYTFERIDDNNFLEVLTYFGETAYSQYELALAKGIAKEQARLLLPLNIYTQFYWTINARSLMNFLSLRNDDAAMYEIRQYAIAIEKLFGQVMPFTAVAFEDNGRVAP